MIRNIEIKLIKSHPSNPRTNLGDLSELSESIKESGVLQNLTVVSNEDGTYTTIIGHRRCAAAELAGLQTVPCVVTEMSEKKQASMMLLENMQRHDLTPYEQAQGFQICLDLGSTVQELSKDTGLSSKTVKHRLKMLELDKTIALKVSEKNLSIDDFIKLEKITDIAERNEVLKCIGTDEFNHRYQRALSNQKQKEGIEIAKNFCLAFANQVETRSDGFEYYEDYAGYRGVDDMKLPEDSETNEFEFVVISYGVTLYRKSDELNNATSDESEQENKLREIEQEKNEQLSTLIESAENTRISFVKGLMNSKLTKEQNEIIHKNLLRSIMSGEGLNKKLYLRLKEVVEPENNTDWNWHQKIAIDVLKEDRKNPQLSILYAIIGSERNVSLKYYNRKYNADNSIDKLVAILNELGYVPSESEVTLYDGTHELYLKEDQ